MQLDEARRQAEQLILDAEKFKATIEAPQGKSSGNSINSLSFNQSTGPKVSGKMDDNFFHLTCHIEEGLREKIEKGEYVELERLLSKDRSYRMSDQTRLEWVLKDGATYLVPSSDRNSKINSVRKWEQAFRVFASIYCNANPGRAGEIWQYIDVIQTAASAYAWDNVYQYDKTFRRLMEFNPERNWGKTYNQMWNLSMREPIWRGNSQYTGNSTGGNQQFYQNKGGQSRKPNRLLLVIQQRSLQVRSKMSI